jgi:hypothetical protein
MINSNLLFFNKKQNQNSMSREIYLTYKRKNEIIDRNILIENQRERMKLHTN